MSESDKSETESESNSNNTAESLLATTKEVLADISATLTRPVHTIESCDAETFRSKLDPLKFYRDFVVTSTPVVFKGAARHLEAFKKCSREYLTEKFSSAPVPVSLTPQGRADAILEVEVEARDSAPEKKKENEEDEGEENQQQEEETEEEDCKKKKLSNSANRKKKTVQRRLFMGPAETEMPIDKFFDMLTKCQQDKPENKQQQPIVYMQPQNDSLRWEPFRKIIPDLFDIVEQQEQEKKQEKRQQEEEGDEEKDSVDKLLPERCSIVKFGSRLFGEEAQCLANFWCGSSRSLTTLHQDHYENFYVVLSGAKDFVLVPPWDAQGVPKETITEGRYEYDEKTGKFRVVIDHELGFFDKEEENMWIDFDEKKAAERGAHIKKVVVEAGDVLYLPAEYYHQVGQSETEKDDMITAVNFWFETEDFSVAHHLGRVIKAVEGHPDSDM